MQARREPGDADLGPVDGPDPGRGADARPDVAHERALDRVVERSGRHEGRGGGDGRRRRVGRVPAKGRHRRCRPDGGQRSVRMERKVGALEGPRHPRDRLVADEEGTEHRLERAPRRLALREHGREAVEPPVAERQAIAAVELAPVGGAPVCERRGVAVEAPPAPVEEGGLRGAGGAGDPLGKGAELRLLPRGDDGGEVVGEEPRNLASAGFGNVPPSEAGRPPRELGQARRDGLSLPATIGAVPPRAFGRHAPSNLRSTLALALVPVLVPARMTHRRGGRKASAEALGHAAPRVQGHRKARRSPGAEGRPRETRARSSRWGKLRSPAGGGQRREHSIRVQRKRTGRESPMARSRAPATWAGSTVADRNGHSRNVSLNGSMVSNRARRFSVTSAPSWKIRAPRS